MMTAIETLLAKPILQALGWALLHFIWQGAIIAALYAVAKIFLRKRAANIRYAAACSALALMLAAPLITLFIMARSSVGEQAIAATSEASVVVEPYAAAAPTLDARTKPSTSGETQTVFGSSTRKDSDYLIEWARGRFALCMPWLLALWFAGVLFLSLRFAGGLAMTHRLRRREAGPALDVWQEKICDLSKRLRVSRPVRLCESLIVEVPTVIGWLRPVILLPASALTGLSGAQIEALLAHELAHVRRYDYLVNLVQTAIETLLFYHPAVWWVSREIREEREHCCDDLAVAACGNVLVYARALAELEQLRIAAPRLAVAANGGSLLRRIQRLIGLPAPASHRLESGLAGVIAIATILFILTNPHALLFSKGSTAEASDSGATTAVAQSGPFGNKMPVDNGAKHVLVQKTESATLETEPAQSVESEPPPPEPPVAMEAEPYPGNPQDSGSSAPQDFIGSMRALGYKDLTADELSALDAHSITPEFVAETNASLNLKLPVDKLIAFRVHEVTASFIENIKAAGLTNFDASDLIAFRVHQVTPQFIADLKALGFDTLPADALIAFRVHGVSTEFIQSIRAFGYDRVSAGELIAFRVHGVTPAFIEAARRFVRGNISIAHLTAFRVHGVSEAFVRELESLGYSNLSADQLTSTRVHGVTPRFITAVHSFGFKPTIDQLLQMRIHRVTPDFIEAVKSRGFNDVTIAQLIELRRMNIIPGSQKK